MAAFRRLASIVNRLNVWSAPRNEPCGAQTTTGGRTQRCLAVGMCLATGGAVAFYLYNDMYSQRCRKRMGYSFSGRDLLPVLTAVEAQQKTRPFDFEEGDVYMSSHEQRFRLFSSVEYEGQLYMTPQNFIESVTMSEPRSIIAYTEYLFLLCILTKPHAGFKIAFNMFDADGNQMVDKREFLVLQEIFRKKNEKKGRKGDVEKSAQLSMQLYGYQVAPINSVVKKDSHQFVARSYWDVLRRGASQALFSDLAEDFRLKRAEEGMMIDTTLLVHFFGKKGKAELTFDDFYRFMDNLQTEVLEIEFLTYSKGMTTISEEDFARILLRYTNVENISSYLDNVRQSIPDEKGITFDEFRSFFQFLNNLEDFAIAMQMYNFASRSIGQDEFGRAVYVATGLKLTRHLVHTIFKIFDVDHDDQLSYKEFIGIMKDRLHRGGRGYKTAERFTSFKSCMKKELAGSR
ncbi:calcium uptake protein 3, mitochondrial-like isoform X6 [Salvelinus fontinalis]|uniref:calcium uptake protein 3, mitochondrial-like isoform X6 n=1 Tax=Salvelinus fontinalis TaxID=8038 RepID=UPI002485D13C|nr:calcium uptake protein 3, mitochondrial-like isoform X6 [Salvelinus fontinalis]